MSGGGPLTELVYPEGEVAGPRPQGLLGGVGLAPEGGDPGAVDAVKHLLQVRGHDHQTLDPLLQLHQGRLDGLQQDIVALDLGKA